MATVRFTHQRLLDLERKVNRVDTVATTTANKVATQNVRVFTRLFTTEASLPDPSDGDVQGEIVRLLEANRARVLISAQENSTWKWRTLRDVRW